MHVHIHIYIYIYVYIYIYICNTNTTNIIIIITIVIILGRICSLTMCCCIIIRSITTTNHSTSHVTIIMYCVVMFTYVFLYFTHVLFKPRPNVLFAYSLLYSFVYVCVALFNICLVQT